MGPSGSGKSTFLQCAARLDRPSGGTVRLGGTDTTGTSENKLTALRRSRVGFVLQAFNLLPSLTVAKVGTVLDRADYTTAQSLDRELNAWANTVMAAVLGGFAAVAAASTLVMTVLDRRRELGTLRLIGPTRRQVMRMIRWEALLLALAGIALGTAIALAMLVPMTKGLTGQAPYIPPLVYGSFAAAIVILGLTAATVPARAAIRGTLDA